MNVQSELELEDEKTRAFMERWLTRLPLNTCLIEIADETGKSEMVTTHFSYAGGKNYETLVH